MMKRKRSVNAFVSVLLYSIYAPFIFARLYTYSLSLHLVLLLLFILLFISIYLLGFLSLHITFAMFILSILNATSLYIIEELIIIIIFIILVG